MHHAATSARAFRRITCGGCPKARRKARRMRSRSAKPVCWAMTSIGWRLCSIISRAASTRRFSTALAGDWPVSARKARLNWRGLRCAALASCRNRQRLVEIALRIGQCALDAVGFGLQLQQRRKLRLATGAPVIDHELPGHGPGDIRAQILFDHSQRQVDARGHPGRGPHRAVDDEDAVFLHLHLWEPSLQVTRAVPVGGRATAVEQACFGQDERAGACRGNSPGSRQSPAQEFDYARRQRPGHGAPADHQCVEIRITRAAPSRR